MKKVWILLIILLCPLVIKAENITNYYINATLNSNGDLLVEEYIELKENTNYFERNIRAICFQTCLLYFRARLSANPCRNSI